MDVSKTKTKARYLFQQNYFTGSTDYSEFFWNSRGFNVYNYFLILNFSFLGTTAQLVLTYAIIFVQFSEK